ncbi:MAG: hypothetical protein HKN17_01465 [Rhodothermales bacterium]|nr:hypothetical protein [Rhodothermales bacterium]
MAEATIKQRASVQVRRIGFAMIVLGAVLIVLFLVPSFRYVWLWFKTLPGPIRFGLGVSAVGLVILILNLLRERWTDRHADRALRES